MAGPLHERPRQLRQELFEAQPLAKRDRTLSALLDEPAQHQEGHSHDEEEDLQGHDPLFGGQHGQGRPSGHRAADGQEGGGQQGETRPPRPETDGGEDEERQQEGEQGVGAAWQEQGPPLVPGEHDSAHGSDPERQQARVDAVTRGRLPHPAGAPGHEQDERGDEGELAQGVGEESSEPHEPVRLAAHPMDHGRVREVRHEGGQEHRPQDEHRHPVKGVEANGGVAPQVHGARRQQGLQAIGDEQGRDEREGEPGLGLDEEVRGQDGEDAGPPTPRGA